MNTKHTPGPWRVAEALDGTMTGVMAGEIYIAPAVWQASAVWDRQQAEREANARLIAAAPEMLEALEGCVELLAFLPKEYVRAETLMPIAYSDDGAINRAMAAIAKARGER